MTPKSIKAAEFKLFSISRALANELWTQYPACGRLRSSPFWWSSLGLNLSTGRGISMLEVDRVVDPVDRLGWFVGTFSCRRFRVATQVWLWERRGPYDPRTRIKVSGLRFLSRLKAENSPSSEWRWVISWLLLMLAVNIKLRSFCNAPYTLDKP